MRIIILGILVLVMSACSSSGSQHTTTIKIPAETFNKKKNQLKNNSVSGMDILMAGLQGIPIPPLGAHRQDVILILAKNNIEIISNTQGRLLVKGSTKPTKTTEKTTKIHGASKVEETVETEVSIENPDYFEFKFENNILVAGPNITNKSK